MKALQRVRTVSFAPLSRLGALPVQVGSEILGGAAAERVIDKALRGRRASTREERRAIAELGFGIGLWRRRAAHHAGCAPDPEHAAQVVFAFLRDLAGAPEDEALASSGLAAPLPVRSPPEEPAIAHSLPDWLWAAAVEELGPEAQAFAEALNQPGPVFLRANALRMSADALAAELRTAGVETAPGAFAPHALEVLGERPNIYGLAAHQRGDFDVQDEGSQLIGVAVDARPGQRVLDFCAGAGGKTLLLAAELKNEGELHAFDVDGNKLERLRTRALHAGVRILRVHHQAPPTEATMDRVLVDAPCSESGALRRGPDLRFRITPDSFAATAELQLTLLEQAAAYVRPGGRLIYATCSFLRAEDEALVRRFLERNQAFGQLEAPVPSAVRTGPALRTWPHRHSTDAFYAAVLERR